MPGILDLAPEKPNVVITPIIIDRDEHSRSKTVKKIGREDECAWGKIEGACAVEVGDGGSDDPCDRAHDPDPEEL